MLDHEQNQTLFAVSIPWKSDWEIDVPGIEINVAYSWCQFLGNRIGKSTWAFRMAPLLEKIVSIPWKSDWEIDKVCRGDREGVGRCQFLGNRIGKSTKGKYHGWLRLQVSIPWKSDWEIDVPVFISLRDFREVSIPWKSDWEIDSPTGFLEKRHFRCVNSLEIGLGNRLETKIREFMQVLVSIPWKSDWEIDAKSGVPTD